MVQVDEFQPGFIEHAPQAGLVEHELGIAAMARSLGDDDFPRTPAPKDLGRRAHDGGMSVDLRRVSDTARQGWASRVPTALSPTTRPRPSSRKPAAMIDSRSAW